MFQFPLKLRAELTTNWTQYVTEGSLIIQSHFSCRPIATEGTAFWKTHTVSEVSGSISSLMIRFINFNTSLCGECFIFFTVTYRDEDENTISEAEMKCVV